MTIDIDLLDEDFHADPHRYHRALREDGDGVHYHSQTNAWLVLRHADALRVFRSPGEFASNWVGRIADSQVPERTIELTQRSMLFSNPPVHTRLRRLVSRAFTPNAVARLGPKISETTLSLIEQFTHGEEIDFIEQIASPLTVTVIAEMLGIPPGDRVDFARWSDASALTIAPVLPAGAREKAFELSVEFARYLRIAVEERHSVPRDDMISALINVELDGERLTDDDIVQMATLLIAAGNETTRTLMANALAVLLAHPHQFQILKDEPTLTPRMVEEVLRFEPSVYYTFRIATQEVQFGATTIPPDSVVLVSIASANRDDREFALPDSLDIARSPNRHVSFASGIHSCLGAPLARLESQLALPLIFGRFTNLTAGSYPPERRIDALTRGLATLPISL